MTGHSIDPDTVGEQLNVEPDAIRAVLDQLPDEITVTAFHGYWSAIGLVEVEDPLSHTGADPAPYALVTFSGHILPFHPNDLETIQKLMDEAAHEFQ